MKSHRRTLGQWGESLAADYLNEKGYRILDKNVYSKYGELDIIALENTRDGDVLVFVEVKTRSTTSFGYPEEAVDIHKREHLLHSARAYLQEQPMPADAWQIDVISIQRLPDSAAPELVHFKDVCS
jgi:putative endonuclease